MADLIIRSRQVVRPDNIGPAAVHVAAGKIEAIAQWDDILAGVPLIDAGDAVVMPGNVDAHVHVNEPGRTEWEGFETATRAAAAGGVTTIVDMPLNSIPPTTTVAGFEEKLAAAGGKLTVDVAFWGGVVPGNTTELAGLVERGVCGFKCFLIHSGVDEFPNVTEEDLRSAMPEIARLGSVLLVHAEVPGPIEAAAQSLAGLDSRAYQTFLQSRPRESENEAVALMVRLCCETGCRVHIVHHSSSDALPMLRAARAEGLPITVETCPHYLTFAAEEIADGATHFKCCPPVRERGNRELLWEAIADGMIDMVVSDHSPCTPALKLQESGDFMEAWGGISALQFGLPVMWTNLKGRGYGLADLTRLMSQGPAKLAGLDRNKGTLAAGLDADIVIWDPEARLTVTAETIEHRHKLTPYDGMDLYGEIIATYVRGERVWPRGDLEGIRNGKLIYH
ncbi:MAG TPA: allantoinase AllB [Pyrinomonadaceae bacterium]|nr:allantoinase AllB [Pyrinomonadaceae bacterium]